MKLEDGTIGDDGDEEQTERTTGVEVFPWLPHFIVR